MKKLFSILFSILLFMGVAFCNATAEEHPEHLTVIATAYPLYDMASQIGGGHLNVLYQPEATAESVADADILLCMGAEKDLWTEALEGVNVIRAVDGIEVIEDEENVLTIPVNNMLVASYFIDILCVADENHSEMYLNNFSVYTEELIALDLSFREAIKDGTKVLCEDGSMAYFAKEYNVEVVDAAAEGVVLLSTYEYPAEEDLTVSYIDLMQRNLEALMLAE